MCVILCMFCCSLIIIIIIICVYQLCFANVSNIIKYKKAVFINFDYELVHNRILMHKAQTLIFT